MNTKKGLNHRQTGELSNKGTFADLQMQPEGMCALGAVGNLFRETKKPHSKNWTPGLPDRFCKRSKSAGSPQKIWGAGGGGISAACPTYLNYNGNSAWGGMTVLHLPLTLQISLALWMDVLRYRYREWPSYPLRRAVLVASTYPSTGALPSW